MGLKADGDAIAAGDGAGECWETLLDSSIPLWESGGFDMLGLENDTAFSALRFVGVFLDALAEQ